MLFHWIHMQHLFCNALIHVTYSVVSGQYSYTIPMRWFQVNIFIQYPCDGFRSIFVYNTHVIVSGQCLYTIPMWWFQVNVYIQYPCDSFRSMFIYNTHVIIVVCCRNGLVGVIVCIVVLIASIVITAVISVTNDLPMTLLGTGGGADPS